MKRRTERAMARFPFEVPFDLVQASIDDYVSVIFSTLESEFLILPKGQVSSNMQCSKLDMKP